MTERLWAPGAATGLGSLPGTDPNEAARLVLGETPDLPYLPELPARGLGADMIGRTGSLLVELPVEWQPHGWTLTSRPGRDVRRARDLLRRDVDAITELGAGVPLLKVQVCGPVTLAAALELPNLHKVLTDHGALRDLAESLAEGVRVHLAELAGRLPGTALVLQLDEPALPAALMGSIPTPSGYGTVRSLDRSLAESAIAEVLSVATAGNRVVHSCAPGTPIGLLRSAGADAIAVDVAQLGVQDLDALGEAIDSGAAIWLGVVPAVDSEISLERARRKVLDLWQRLGFAQGELAGSVVPTPACGMAGASPAYARRAMTVLRDTGRAISELA